MTSPIVVSQRSWPFYIFLIFAVLFSIQVLPRLSGDSPVGDENVEIANGFYYWQGDVISGAEHPPLPKALQALPLRFMGLRWKSNLRFSGYAVRDAYFLTVLNFKKFEAILESARFITYLFGLGLGLALFMWIRQESIFFVLSVLTLWAFQPVILAFSGFAMAEIPLTFFFFIASIQFQKLIQKPTRTRAVMVGGLSAMAVTSQFTAFLLLPIFLVLEIKNWMGVKPRPTFPSILNRWVWGLISAFLWVCVVYIPGTLLIPSHPWPTELFIQALEDVPKCFVGFAFYFRGILSYQAHWDYFPTAFILKSPLTFLFLLVLALLLGILRRIPLPAWQWMPPLVFFSVFLFYHQVGIRMILPIYPFCILMAGRAGEWMASPLRTSRILFPIWIGLLIFQALSVGLRFPAQISYFNELVAPEKRLYWLGDSNLDFGQDTKRLAVFAKEHDWRHIKLAYFGTADPRLYGMQWNYWTRKDLRGPQPGWVYAINDEYIQIGPSFSPWASDILKSWIMKVPPSGRIGDTWYYFEIPGKVHPDHSPRIISAPLFLDAPHSFFQTR